MNKNSFLQCIAPPMQIISRDGIPQHNDSLCLARCPTGHQHKYYFADMTPGESVQCKTCSAKNRRVRTARGILEKYLRSPFTLSAENKLFCPVRRLFVQFSSTLPHRAPVVIGTEKSTGAAIYLLVLGPSRKPELEKYIRRIFSAVILPLGKKNRKKRRLAFCFEALREGAKQKNSELLYFENCSAGARFNLA